MLLDKNILVSKDKGSFTEDIPPEQKNLDYEIIKQEAQKLIGDNKSIYLPKPEGVVEYHGPIIAKTTTHAIQQDTMNSVRLHELQSLQKTPEIGDNLSISYKDGKLDSVFTNRKMEHSKDKTRSSEIER